ncbi:hypothetical protein [Glycomyces tarimensis]
MRIAITGHRDLTGATAIDIDNALRQWLADLEEADSLVGLTCLADGADRLFANAVLDFGGTLEVIVPTEQYRETLRQESLDEYDRLLDKAAKVTEFNHPEPDGDAFMAASLAMLDTADRLLAVWDGLPPRGPGGTAEVVDAAREREVPVTVMWPDGASRG